MKLLINKDDFKNHIHISEQIDSFTHVLPRVQEVQAHHLRPALGKDFFDEVLTELSKSPATAAYVELEKQIKPFLVWQTMAEITSLHAYNFVSYGIVKKNNPQMSEPISEQERAKLVSKFEAKAESYKQELFAYLDDNKEIFTTWKEKRCGRDSDRGYNISISAV